jgi:hypothetical protein
MTVAVAFPWRPQPERLDAFAFTRRWWEHHYPDALFAEIDTDHQPFNLAACRNEAVRWAEERHASVVVLCDADSVPADRAAVDTAIAASADGRLHLPFSLQRYLNQAETEALYRGELISTDGSHGNGACWVLTPDAYWSAGGSDERFSGWGGDDDGFIAAAKTLTGMQRHPGTMWSLWHADECRDVGSERHRPNAELAQRYWRAIGDRAAIEELIAER